MATKSSRLVIDGALGAQLDAGGAFFGTAGGGEDPRAEGMGKLDGRGADAAGAAMHQEGLARLQTPAIEDVGPDGEEGLGNGAGLGRIHAAGKGQALRRGRRAEFGIAAARHQRTGLIADLPAAYIGAQRHDTARDLQPRNVGSARRRAIAALALQHVGPVDAGGGDLDQHLTRARLGHRPLGGLQHIRSAKFGDLDDVHGVGYGIRHGLSHDLRGSLTMRGGTSTGNPSPAISLRRNRDSAGEGQPCDAARSLDRRPRDCG